MSNISKFINVLNTYLEVESFSPLVYKFPIALNPCNSSNLDKSIMSYIDNGFLLCYHFSSNVFSIARLESSKKQKGINIASCFGYVLDNVIKINPAPTPLEHAFSVVVEFLTSRACKCLFAPYTHFTVDANIPNELFTLRCSYKGVKNFITLRNGNDHLSIELA